MSLLTPEEMGAINLVSVIPADENMFIGVKIKGNYCLIDGNSKCVVTKKPFKDIGPFSGGRAIAVLLNKKTVYIDKQGNIIGSPDQEIIALK
jgi:hypothetical protein